MGVSVGPRGAHVSVNTKGQLYSSAGIPGTGLYNVQRTSLHSPKSPSSSESAIKSTYQQSGIANTAPQSPGLFSGKAEKEFFKYIRDIYDSSSPLTAAQVSEKASVLIGRYPDLSLLVQTAAVVVLLSTVATATLGEEWVKKAWENRLELAEAKLFKKYFPDLHVTIYLAHGVGLTSIFDIAALGYLYSESLQRSGKYLDALAVVQGFEQNIYTRVAIADLQVALGKYDEIIASTEDLINEDDPTALLLTFRGVALREEGFYEAAREAFRTAHASKKRSEDVLNFTLFERATCYEMEQKYALALKDLEKIMATDSSYEGLMERITKLRAESHRP